MPPEKRSEVRVGFKDGYSARILAIDGTWQRPCLVLDVSKSGAKIAVEGSLEDIRLDEFFLALSFFGTAHRRCRTMWLSGDMLGVTFVRQVAPPKRRTPPGTKSPGGLAPPAG